MFALFVWGEGATRGRLPEPLLLSQMEVTDGHHGPMIALAAARFGLDGRGVHLGGFMAIDYSLFSEDFV